MTTRPRLVEALRRLGLWRWLPWAGWLALMLGGLTQAVLAATTVTVGSDPSKSVLQGRLVTPDAIIDGELVIDGETITCVAVDCPDPPGATRFVISDAYIVPGFIDAHNHVAYNVLPKWTPPKRYQNRGQWQRAAAYKAFKQPYARLKDHDHLFCEMVKYGELKALLSGVTTIQGTAPNQACFRTLIRNAENQNELGTPPSYIRTFILDIKSFKGPPPKWAVTKAFVVHLAEGVDGPSRQEFATLKQKGLLTAQTAIIHGTAFGDSEFAQMARVGAKLIWSPQSNLALYGQTTNIKLAVQHGVLVSLGVDWNPTGSDTIFDELRVAAKVNEENFAHTIADGDWLKLITVNPATALALETQIGKLAAGFKADVTVLEAHDPDPGRSLLKTQLPDVHMVWVGGELLYGDETVLEQVKAGVCEAFQVQGANKRVCVKDTKEPVAKSTQTKAEIQARLLAHYPQLAPLAP
jgi:5-methylthioadenosine/S-adenosylhomocysteine deaminase